MKSRGEHKSSTFTWMAFASFLISCLFHMSVHLQEASVLLQLRMKWNVLFLRRMHSPAKPWSTADEDTMRAVVKALTNHEQAMGLTQPIGIGQRPRPAVCEDLPAHGRSARARKAQVEVPDMSSTERYAPEVFKAGVVCTGGPAKITLTLPSYLSPIIFCQQREN